MKILEFDKNLKEDKKESIELVNNAINKATHFIITYSDDNLKTSRFIDFNVGNFEAIALLDILKHVYLHRVLPSNGDDEDPDKKDIPLCVGE